MTIEKGTLDFKSYIYPSATDNSYRWVVETSPDFPGCIDLSYEELEDGNYKKIREIDSLDKETWEKISLAADVVLNSSI